MTRPPQFVVRAAFLVSIAVAGLLGVSACSGRSVDAGTPAPSTLTVGAASSLTEAFTVLGDAFMKEHPDIAVRFSFAGSSAIAEQIAQGAPIDGFASAGKSSIQPLVDQGLVTQVADFATNALEIAVPPGNPASIGSLADLGKGTLVVCKPEVPCGVAYGQLVKANGLSLTPVSLEADVKAVLTKVASDEADAGIVYVTDVKAAGDQVLGIPIPPNQNVTSTYQIAVVADSSQTAAMQEFIEFVRSPQGQDVLTDAGFGQAP